MSDKEPLRWKDSEDAPAGMRSLLAHGRAISPMPADVRAALEAGLLPGLSTASAPVRSPTGAVKLGAWVAGGSLVVALAISGLVWRGQPPETSPRPHVVAAKPSVEPPAESDEPESVESVPAVQPSPPVTPTVAAFAQSRPSTPRPPRAPAVLSADGPLVGNLAEENLLIGRARSNLAADPVVSIMAVDEHARRFPRGELSAEREYLRVRALTRLGRNDEARTYGQRYLSLFPSSPYAPSVQTMMAELGTR